MAPAAGCDGIFGPSLTPASTYLGLTEAQIRTQLQSGKTLADIATAQGKTAAGLVDALVTAETAAARPGRQGRAPDDAAQEQQILGQLKQRVTDAGQRQVRLRDARRPRAGLGMVGPQNYFRHNAARSTPKTAL